ncbi:hypothetical protein VIBNISOn1_1480011 [Vibrio nigripulchritudo SOn1]|uniref:Uncharacterized protein n=1 Tax=Vibrio nigripulchritudo SOn1 TaxID=1238450 RepID=A0AAV2VL65_9VIBR|nr:hypothetical protein [Vibrio nigripulchritudo]CCO45437.1 hypothetical protein VIBNISOn1_1480011 [Vibrio nigripulchritudo SOn1]
MGQSEEEFYEELNREVDEQFTAILEQNIQPLLEKKIDAPLWCRKIAFDYHISEDYSASYLKKKHNINVELLPEPEITITIECEACLGSPYNQCFECFSMAQDEPERD